MKYQGRATWFALVFLLLLVRPDAFAGSGLNPAHPLSFFTNVASRLLKAEMNVDLNRIQIWPTNQYTPAVHRLLQVSANLYEATTNRFDDVYPHLPTLFRPQFTNDGGIVYICGYVEETNSAFLGNTLRDILSSNVANAVQRDDLILGVPLVIGAKKGLPNFNEFAMETVLQMTRKVELIKSSPGGANTIIQTNQMLILGISNVFGAEFWNSYSSNFTRTVDIYVTNYCRISLTNDFGFSHHTNIVMAGVFGTNLWPRWTAKLADASFIAPLRSNHITLRDSVYRFGSTNFVVLTDVFERPSGFAYPQWGITVTNRIVATIKERDTQRIIDFVSIKPAPQHWDFSAEIAQPLDAIGFDGVWATNAPWVWLGEERLIGLPGIIQQIEISKGNVEPGGNWANHGLNQPQGATRNQAIANFLAFFESSHVYLYQTESGTYFGTNSSLVANAPFTPTVKCSFRAVWQANDPRVHYLATDLLGAQPPVTIPWTPPSATTNTIGNIGRLNEHYQPWGGRPFTETFNDPNAYNLAIKDPQVRSSDAWNFANNGELDLSAIARIHRGTPWQTLYLKSLDLNFYAWQDWLGNWDWSDTPYSRPIRDWNIIATLLPLLKTNPHALLSINDLQTNNWLTVLDNISVLTNSATDQEVIDGFGPMFDTVIMSSNSPQASILMSNVFAKRSAQPNQKFTGLEALLAIPQLSDQSPWLNLSPTQSEFGLTDEAYEMIPVQLLSRLRPDPIGTISTTGNTWQLQFTGYDDYPYAVEVSSNLLNWTRVSTNVPVNGTFTTTYPQSTESSKYFRSVLLPQIP